MSETDEFDDLNKQMKFKARIKNWLIVAVIGIICGSVAILFLIKQKKEPAATLPQTISLDAASRGLDIDQIWRHKLEENITSQSNQITKQMSELKAELLQNSQELESKKDQEIKLLKDKLKFLEAELEDNKQSPDNMNITNQIEILPKISKYRLNLVNSKNHQDYQPIKTADNYIAAGSFVKGVLLSGIDVSTAIKTISDPEPVLIKLIDYGTLPRKFQSDLKDCHIVASSFGDLSSERAKIRAEKLSCVELKTGEVIETEIAGYAAGEDGRSGLRGQVVSVDQKYLANAQIFGTLGGITKSAIKEPNIVNPLLDGNQSLSNKDRIGGQVLTGTGSSLDKLAEYYIERAEAIQPVIQIAAGRKVDVVFTEGVYFGSSELKQSLAKKREGQIKAKAETESSYLIEQMEKK